MATAVNKRVLFVSYTYTQQARRVTEAMTDTLEAGGCDVTTAKIELADKRWPKNFFEVPDEQRVHRCAEDASCTDAQGDPRDQGPKRRDDRPFRPRRHRFADVVADDQHPDPVVSQIAGCGHGARRRGILVVRRMSPLLGIQPPDGAALGPRARLGLFDAGPLRCWSYSMRRPEMARAITSCWICSVPSKMSKIFASRCMRSTGYSRV